MLKKIDGSMDACKEVMIELLPENPNTPYMDVDSFTWSQSTGWYFMEWLRCESVPPQTSHPKYYWSKNKGKFLTLFRLALDAKGTLFLINYNGALERFKVIQVLFMDADGIKEELTKVMNREQFKTWLNNPVKL